MTGFWLASYIVLWLIVVAGSLIIMALAREIEELHKRIDSLQPYLTKKTKNNNEAGQ
jgi:predicted Holliday junction resolvase-like endonuclease